MTKTIKICDKCGKECTWLYKLPIMVIKGYNIEFYDDTPCGAANNECCENCARKIVEKINDIVLL